MKYFSVCVGVGGFEEGIKKAHPDWECVGMSEIDKYCCQLLDQKYPEVKNYGDIKRINPEELPDFEMLCGGIPCQAFSLAGKRKGFEDTRGTIFFDVARIAKVKRPKLLFLENVKGLLNHNKGETFRVILQALDELGYDVEWQLFNSKYFGVPQNRERVFIIGHLRGEPFKQVFPFPSPSGTDKAEHKVETITYQWDISGKGYDSQQDRAYRTDGVMCTLPNANPKNKINIINHWPRSGNPKQGGTGVLTSDEHCFCLDRTPHIVAQRGRENGQQLEPRKDRVTNSLTSVQKDNYVIEDMEIRRLTPEECEKLQGFEPGWTEGFSDTTRYKMMGNAVTVNIIEAIAKRL